MWAVCLKAAMLRRALVTTKTATSKKAMSSKSRSWLDEASVLVSASHDVFTNLALEDWLYRHVDLSARRLLLLWQNAPCVVIGRHQNPWMEANLGLMAAQGLPLARRQSGGGAVYHDEGNLNCTFFSSKKEHERESNLRLLCKAINKLSPKVHVDLTHRHDLLLQHIHKISGTAAKLGRLSSYHHCTLLVDVDVAALRHTLTSKAMGVASRATASVRAASVANLRDFDATLSVEKVVEAVAAVFVEHTNSYQKKVVHVVPSEDNFEGIEAIREELASWKWVFGKTPAFQIERRLPWPTTDGDIRRDEPQRTIDVRVALRHGLVDEVEVEADWLLSEPLDRPHLEAIRGLPLDSHLAHRLQRELGGREVDPRLITVLKSVIEGVVKSK